MSFYNLIELSNLTTISSYIPAYSPELMTLPSLFFVPQEAPFVSNLYFSTPLNQNQNQLTLQQQTIWIQEPEAVMKRGVKKRTKNMQKEL